MTDEATDKTGFVPATELVGCFYAWWQGDPLPEIPPDSDLSMEPCEDAALVARVTSMAIEEVRRRFDHGHRLWLAKVCDEPSGWGWVATREAGISELGIAITLSPGERYLWDFMTLPAWRDHGVYTSLLQVMLEREGAGRYWIGHDEGNEASARGIVKAGFRQVGTAQRLDDGRIVFVSDPPSERAVAAADLLGLPMIAP